ncbi:MAG TPA: DNA repair protein RecN [Chitinophagaceae bacterium]|nr:MAG: DNA replication and repair protein RecN [Bacteroidetes bacterium OLB11]HMN31892.1 DNA repair protein RecN [Chitinophagaceae bacterium]
MLKKIYIKNFAIINEASIDFENGFTVITGETGAGKSILIGALSLVMGERADSKYFLSQQDKCIVEATFDIEQNDEVKKILSEFDFDIEPFLNLRREINKTSKSRAFINDTPATIQQLSTICKKMLDLHRQFDTIELQQNAYQLSILDSIIFQEDDLKKYVLAFHHWKKLKQNLEDLQSRNAASQQEMDYLQFVYQELENLQLKDGEIEQMEQELRILENATAFKQDMEYVQQLMNEGDAPLLMLLKQIISRVENQSKINPDLKSLLERLNVSHIELKDINQEIESLSEKIYYDESTIQNLTQRLDYANKLLKKYHLHSSDELIKYKDEVEQKILQVQNSDEEEKELTNKVEQAFAAVSMFADSLHQKRVENIPQITQHLNAMLNLVGMPNAQLSISIQEVSINERGIDNIDFLFDANKSGVFKPLSKVASGGELSRIMLCIKSIVSKSTQLPTLIFDEIDTGISGETAIQVGNVMKQLAENHQLICITHLPQIAGKATQHLYIYKKENEQGSVQTYFKLLNENERIDTLSEMLSGKNSGEHTKEMVKEFLKK